MSEESTATSMSSNNGACVVCYKNVEIYSIGMCEHPVCYECSTRMRVLCKQNECPICRQDLPKVVFTKEIKSFRHIRKGNLLDTRYNIYFENMEVQEKFTQLLSHACNICRDKQVFSSFNSLKDHMRRKHELHYCDLCVENLKIFSCERRCYTRADLAHHRREGDVDDRSHKGHPLCIFCDCRYMDNDELFRHVRRDHLYCHFCDADGLHQYYHSYDNLRDHFRQVHHLCEEGPCLDEEFTSVFRTDIDLKAHKASVHGKHLGKAAAKQARTLELEFTLAPRGNARNNRRGPMASGPSNSRNRDYVDSRDYQESEFLCESEAILMRQPDVQSTEEFPSLGNSSVLAPMTQAKSKGRGNLTIRSSLNSQPLAVTDENFPALGPESSSNPVSKTVNLNVYSTNRVQQSTLTGSQRPQNATPNVSIQVNHKTDGSITTRVSGPNVRIRPAQLSRDSDFPALRRNEASMSSPGNSSQWTKITCVKPSVFKHLTTTPPPPLPPASPSPVSFTEAFPSLPKSAKNKKQSSISVTTNNNKATSSDAVTWNRSLANESETNAAMDANKTNTKKKKKKKVKQTSSGNNSSGNESTASKSHLQRDKKPSNVSIDNDNAESSKIVNTENNDNGKIKKDRRSNQSSSSSNSSNPVGDINNETTTTTNGIRKRSELKIDNLINTNSSRKIEDFPALNKSIRTKISNPPPGFGTTTPPPPGFAVKLNSTEQSSGDNALTFTNSSGECFTILPDNKNYPYLPPADFQKRNKNLVSKISQVLENQKESIEEFRYLSGLFRQGSLSVEHYYKRCRSAMGNDEFRHVFPEMLVLLPDINKQRELYDLHKNEIGNIKGLELCENCGQVVKSGNDLKLHLSSHTLENHFPELGEATSMQTNTWVRKGT